MLHELLKWKKDIILEGFLEAERVHRLHYTQFIGDGDSSVHLTLIQNVPIWVSINWSVLTTRANAIVEHLNSW